MLSNKFTFKVVDVMTRMIHSYINTELRIFLNYLKLCIEDCKRNQEEYDVKYTIYYVLAQMLNDPHNVTLDFDERTQDYNFTTLIDAVKEKNIESYTNIVYEIDQKINLDPIMTTILLTQKNKLRE